MGQADFAGRFAVDVGATLFRSDGRVLVATIVGLSFEGCQIECDGDLATGECCRLYRSGQGCIEAEVQWFEDGRAGLIFLSECRT